MADLNKTIQIIFGATDKTGTVISGLSGRLDSIAGPVSDLTGKFLLLEGAIGAAGIAFGVKAYSESVKFEGALLDLQKVMDESDGDARRFTGTVDALSNKYGVAATDILQGAADFKQAGFSVKESFELQKTALDLVVGGNIEASRASELLVSTLKGFKAPASEANRLADVQNEISNKYATNLEQLAVGMAEFSPIAAKMNFSFEETAGVLTPVIEVFRSGSEAAIALKTGLLRLVSDEKPVLDTLEQLGVSQRGVNGELRSGRDILLDVAKAFTTLDENQKLAVTSQLTGIHQAARMSEVFDGLAKSTEVTNAALNSAGSISKEVEKRLEAAEKQTDRMKVGFNNMARSIGDQFRPELAGVIGSITEMEAALQSAAEGGGFEPLFRLIRPQLKEWQDVLGKIASALPEAFKKTDFTPLLNALGRVRETVSEMFDGLDLTKPADLAAAINRLIKIGGTMIGVTGGIINVFGRVGQILLRAVEWFSGLDPATQKTIGGIGGVSVALTTLLIPALTLTGGAISLLTGARGIGSLIAVLTGSLGLTTAIGNATTKVSGLNAALGVGHFQKVAGAGGIGAITTALGKAGLAGAVGIASFELGKLIDKYGTSKILFPEKSGIVSPAVTDAEMKTFTDRVEAERAARGGQALPGENFPFEMTALEAIRKGTAIAALEVEKSGKIVTGAKEKELAATGRQTDAEKKLLDVIEYGNALSLPGENTEAERAALDAIREKTEAMGAFNRELGATKQASLDVTRAFETSISSLSTGITSTESTISNLVNSLVTSGGGKAGRTIENVLAKELSKSDQEFKLQKELIESKIKLNDARVAKIESGDALIKISADGLEPELEAFMWPILERIQIRANADGAEYLLGI